MIKIDENALKQYANYYDEKNMWNKIKEFFVEAGINLVIKVLQLWYLLQKPEVPVHVKIAIMGAIAYFVMPVDLILDVLPGGYHDDLLAVTLTLLAAEEYIDDEVRRKARERLVGIVLGKIGIVAQVADKSVVDKAHVGVALLGCGKVLVAGCLQTLGLQVGEVYHQLQ